MKILLACSSGMSTSLLVNKMKEAATEQSVEAEIWAVGQAEVETEMPKADVVLFGPQMRFLKTKFSKHIQKRKKRYEINPKERTKYKSTFFCSGVGSC